MPPRLIIHLGDRKTCSTSIQAALRQEAWEGAPVSELYPAAAEAPADLLRHIPREQDPGT